MVLSIAAGGAIGSVLRFYAARVAVQMFGIEFPYGTLYVNVIGSFIMGLLVEYFGHSTASQELRAFLAIGVLGGFTTFSTFSLDVATLYQRGETTMAALYILLSLVLSIGGIFAGMFIVRSFVQ